MLRRASRLWARVMVSAEPVNSAKASLARRSRRACAVSPSTMRVLASHSAFDDAV